MTILRLKKVVHISESEAASDFARVMTPVREGSEIVIERDAKTIDGQRRRENQQLQFSFARRG